MTLIECAICNDLLQNPGVLQADTNPKLPGMKVIAQTMPNVVIFSVRLKDISAWVETPVSRNLVEVDDPNVRKAIVKAILDAVRAYSETPELFKHSN